jgi:hypothetical protein
MPLHRARTPGERHAGFDRRIVLAEPLGKASHGLQRTGGGARQPGIEAFGLPLAHECRNVLGQVDGFGHVGLLGAQVRELLRLGGGTLLRAPEHQPGGPAWGQGLVRRFGHPWQRLPCTSLSGGQALGLTQAAGIGRHEAIASGIATPLEVAKQPHRGVAARIPALEERGFVGIQQAAAAVTPPLAPQKGGGLEIPLHGARTNSNMLCDGGDRPALAMQGLDLLIHMLPARLALGGALLGRRGRVCRRHGYYDHTIGHRHRLLAQRRIDHVEHLAMGGEDLI